MQAILVRGTNEVGSAVALRLFNAGFPVVLHDEPRPDTNRRTTAFSDCAFDGEAWFGGVHAVLSQDPRALAAALSGHGIIPMAVQPLDRVLRALCPDILIDARMRIRDVPERQIGLAPLTIGLGPNFVAGETTDLIVETGWGDDMGQVSDQGATRALEGDPHPIDGHSRDRFIYAPLAGLFRTSCVIGQVVTQGESIGSIDDSPLQAPLSGMIKGLIHDGTPIRKATKIVEVDPRGAEVGIPTGMATRPARIAEGILAAVRAWERRSAPIA